MSPGHTAEVFVSDNSFRSHPLLPLINEVEPQRDQRAKLEASQHHPQKTLQDTANSRDVASTVSRVLGFFLISFLEINFHFNKKVERERKPAQATISRAPNSASA